MRFSTVPTATAGAEEINKSVKDVLITKRKECLDNQHPRGHPLFHSQHTQNYEGVATEGHP